MASKAIEMPIQPFFLLSIRIAYTYSVWKKGTARIQLSLLSIAQLGTVVQWIAQWMIHLWSFFLYCSDGKQAGPRNGTTYLLLLAHTLATL